MSGRGEGSLNGVDVGFVTSKGLHSFSGTNIPNFGGSIASTRNEDILIGTQRKTDAAERLQRSAS